jgi:Erv1 / Alr family
MSININPSNWGPSAWKFLHYVTLSYPDNPANTDKIKFYNFFINIKEILPCEKCRYNFNEHLKKYPLTDDVLSARFFVVNWLINIHNEVNISLGKPTMTYNQFLETYLNQNANNTNDNSLENISTQTMIIILIIVLILILILAIKIKNCL